MKPIKTRLGAALLSLFLLGACDRLEPTSYTIPKEERPANINPPGAVPPTPPASSDKTPMPVLPGMAEAAAAAPNLFYEIPEGWEEFPARSVRKANFRVSDSSGRADITVTTFPGDVGGLLANVNRWRSQVGLNSIEKSGLESIRRPFPISDHDGTIVSLQGPSESILGGILGFHGNTWFFKMQGDTGTVAAQAEAMEAFLASIQIEDRHH